MEIYHVFVPCCIAHHGLSSKSTCDALIPLMAHQVLQIIFVTFWMTFRFVNGSSSFTLDSSHCTRVSVSTVVLAHLDTELKDRA